MATSFENDPVQLLGRDLNAQEVVGWLRSIDPATKVVVFEGEPSWSSRASGLELQGANKSSLVTTVSFYAEGVDDFRQYKAPLPHKVTFGMRRPQVRAALGSQPKFTSDEHDAWDFDTHRFIVMYDDETIQRVAITGDF